MEKILPRVSVLMAVFNTASFLNDALISIQNQSFQDFELIVVDDGSTDGSTQILEMFASQEPRMHLITRQNKGLIATRNELLSAARGDLIAWMDSDDISTPDRLALQVTHIDSHPSVVCLGGFAQCMDPHGSLLNLERYPLAHSDILLAQQRGGAMRFATTMMRRNLAIRVGGFREPFRIGEDFDLLLRMSELGEMANLSNTVYFYRQHLHSVCASLGPGWQAYRDQILALARERQELGQDKLQRGEVVAIDEGKPGNIKHLESHTYLRWAQAASENGNIPLAWKYAVAATIAQPLAKEAWKNLVKVVLRMHKNRLGVQQ
jgi:glycosyltransferase involved in cell wall biosynthesis